MNNLLSPPYVAITTALLLAAGSTHSGHAAAAAEVHAGVTKSVFNDQIGRGKDPFFPNSRRLAPKPAPGPTGAQLNSGNTSWVVLNGFSAAPNGKLVIINGRTFAEGEEYILKNGNQSLKVKCIMIKEDSVEVEINGTTKELKLRRGL